MLAAALLLLLAGLWGGDALRMPRPHAATLLRAKTLLLSQSSSTGTPSATLTTPPTSFLECVRLSVIGARAALAEGKKLLEVEFPPLPLDFLEDSSSSARDIADANTRWAIEFARTLAPEVGQVTIVYPDDAELSDAIKYVETGDNPLNGRNPFPGVTLATIRADSVKNALSLDQMIGSIFGATFGGEVAAVPGAKMYVAVVSSTQELPDLEKLHLLDPSVPIVFFNLRLDVLRGDLGLPLFPKRDLHYRFLSQVLPAFLMRSRSFATSLRRPPFIINYSGLLFRRYPEPYQSFLNTGGNKSKLVKSSPDRPTNMGFRDALTDGLYIPNVPREELRAAGNLVWWEKESSEEKNTEWRR
jgi:hypothetical protein